VSTAAAEEEGKLEAALTTVPALQQFTSARQGYVLTLPSSWERKDKAGAGGS
jgi:hypothetical protein